MTARTREHNHRHWTPPHCELAPPHISPATLTSRSYASFPGSMKFFPGTTRICNLRGSIAVPSAAGYLSNDHGYRVRRLDGAFTSSAIENCGRPSSDTLPLLPFGRPLLYSRASVLPGSAREEDQVLLRACVREGVSCPNHRAAASRRPQECGAPHCPMVQSIAPEFTAPWREPSGRSRRPSIGPQPQASSRAWRNTGWPAARSATRASSRCAGCSIEILTGALRGRGRPALRCEASADQRCQPNEVNARGRAPTRSVAVRAVKYPARRGASHRALFCRNGASGSASVRVGFQKSSLPSVPGCNPSGVKAAGARNPFQFGSYLGSSSINTITPSTPRACLDHREHRQADWIARGGVTAALNAGAA